MDVRAHFLSLTRELEALKDRVRNFSSAPHWQTVGEWKESVLRATLRRYLPPNIEPLRGFIVTEMQTSRQIDVLLYDATKPVLFRDGDLVFVPPDAVLGIVEVKSRVDGPAGLRSALAPLTENASLLSQNSPQEKNLFVGFFSYETTFDAADADAVLGMLRKSAGRNRGAVVDHLCLGCSLFLKFWENAPGEQVEAASRTTKLENDLSYRRWHCYELNDLAAGYFIGNLIESVAPESVRPNSGLWFPEEGKELRLVCRGAL